MRNYYKSVLLSALFITFLFGCSTNFSKHKGKVEPLIAIVSIQEPSINRNDEISEFLIGKDTLFIATEWNSLSNEPLKYLCEIYDGNNNLVFIMGGRLFSQQENIYYQSNYTPLPAIDQPGKWKILIYANDALVYKKEILGTASDHNNNSR